MKPPPSGQERKDDLVLEHDDEDDEGPNMDRMNAEESGLGDLVLFLVITFS